MPPKDAICFHCKQAAEKYLKAILQETNAPIDRADSRPRSDSLWLLPHFPALRSLRRGVAFLTDFAVETRYQGKNASKRQMRAVLRWAERVRTECRKALDM